MARAPSSSRSSSPSRGNALPPAPLTSLVGREEEIRGVSSLLRQTRLVSLTGAGGSGKTRVAQEVASRMAAGFPDGVAWVDLASLSSPALLPQRVESAVGALHEEQRGSHEALVSTLAQRSMLLVLDSCEHLVEACASLAEELLLGCPDLRILLTTREALGLSGEHAWHLPPLSLPTEPPPSVEALLASESARLFVDRARAARADFTVSMDNAEAIARICKRLDGIPLAIELAAARIRALSPGQISDRLDHAFRLLSEGSRSAPPRHRTLRAAIDWSYDLLSEEDKVFLPRLSVFRGAFPLSAVEAVSGPDADPFEVFDRISRLVDRSLVLAREERGSVRYQLLETVRQYAEEKLGEGADRETLEERHARFFLSVAQEAEAFLTSLRRREWVDRLSRDLDNIRHALAWSDRHHPRLNVELAAALSWFWLSSRHWWEGRRWAAAALAHTEKGERSPERARLLFSSGVLTCLQGRPEAARPRLQESAAISEGCGDERLRAYALAYLGLALSLEGHPDAGTHLDSALGFFRRTDDPHGLRLSLLLTANLAVAQGRLDEAESLGREAVGVARGFGADRELAVTLQTLSVVALELGELDRAMGLARESLETLRHDPSDLFSARGLEIFAAIGLRRKQWEASVPLAGTADAVRTTLDAVPFGLDRERLEPLLLRARGELGIQPFERLWAQGRDMSLDRAVDLVLHETVPEDKLLPDPGSAPTPILRVLALGPLEIYREGVLLDVEAWRLQKSRELLVHLLCYPNGRTREQIGTAFWPNHSPTQVKNSFHVTLHHLRKALGGADRVVIEGDRYRVNPDLQPEFDVHKFERDAKAALLQSQEETSEPTPLRTVLSLYRGEFLEEEGAGDWHLEHRDRLRLLHLDGLVALSRILMRIEAYPEAQEVLMAAIRADQFRGEAHRNLITCYARTDRRAEALRHFDHLAHFLREEVDSPPEPTTVELVERIRAGGSV